MKLKRFRASQNGGLRNRWSRGAPGGIERCMALSDPSLPGLMPFKRGKTHGGRHEPFLKEGGHKNVNPVG